MEIGLAYCGDPEAFYAWPIETQERVLGWWRAKHTSAAAPAKKGASKAVGSRDALAFWGLE